MARCSTHWLKWVFTDAAKIEPDFEVGEELYEEIDILDLAVVPFLLPNKHCQPHQRSEENVLIKNTATVSAISSARKCQVWKKNLLLDEEGNELILPKSEQIPQDYFKKGENIRAVVARVDLKNNSPVIILSRTSPLFLAKLLEMKCLKYLMV